MPRKKERIRQDDDSNPTETESSSCKRKYGRRPIQSNWDRYDRYVDAAPTEADDVKPDDFVSLANASALDCDYFQFKSEKKWEAEALQSRFAGHKLFNLDLELLAKALACVPFCDRVDVDKSRFSRTDLERCERKAEECRSVYAGCVERHLRKLVQEARAKGDAVPKSKTVQSNSESHPCGKNNQLSQQEIKVDKVEEDIVVVVADAAAEKDSSEESQVQSKSHNVDSNKDENLEDWLDSILDD